MGKSSSSRKKKRSDASPPVRTKKKSKSRRTKSKKLRRRHDSYSSSSGYDSPSTSSASLSSSGDDYRRRKRSRSPARGSAKGSKRKDRKLSYSSESSEDLPLSKKRKGSRKYVDSRVRKKSYKKKRKLRERRSVSSSDSGSLSCSTCQEEISRSEESEFERHKNKSRSKRKGNDDDSPQASEKGQISSKRSRYESRSCTPCSSHSIDGADDRDEGLVRGSNSVRLRSVIIVVNERNLDEDERKQEIIYDNDDYPSCRSNDSNEGGSKRELASHFYVDSKMEGEEACGEANAFSIRSPGPIKKSGSGGDLRDERSPCSNVALVAVDAVKDDKNKASDVGKNDLESMLRQRALENLKRFKGKKLDRNEISSDPKDKNADLKQSATVSAGLPQISLPKEDSAKAPEATQGQASSLPSLMRISADIAPIDGKSCYKGVSAKQPAIRGLHPIAAASRFNQMATSPAGSPRITPFTWRRDTAISEPLTKTSHPARAKPAANEAVNKSSAKLAETGPSANKASDDAKLNQPCGSGSAETSSGPKPAADERETTKDQAKDGPQYEQKAVSVMQGGETMQQQMRLLRRQSHPSHVKPAANEVGSAKLAEAGPSASKASDDAKLNRPFGSASAETSSSPGTSTGGSEPSKDEAKDGPRYEQKTMSVMRGGEMIQVNYQVYIPKRAPALARRQLKK